MTRSLPALMRTTTAKMDELLEDLVRTQDVDAWQRSMAKLISSAHIAAYQLGSGRPVITLRDRDVLVGVLGDQVDYLNRFADKLAERDGGTPTSLKAARARAVLYARAIKESYWRGKTAGLDLPGYPGKGTDCYSNCGCKWRIEDRGDGDYDCYWELGKRDNCDTCLSRNWQWYPYRIRSATKHLPGKHDQKSHGRKRGAQGREQQLIALSGDVRTRGEIQARLDEIEGQLSRIDYSTKEGQQLGGRLHHEKRMLKKSLEDDGGGRKTAVSDRLSEIDQELAGIDYKNPEHQKRAGKLHYEKSQLKKELEALDANGGKAPQPKPEPKPEPEPKRRKISDAELQGEGRRLDDDEDEAEADAPWNRQAKPRSYDWNDGPPGFDDLELAVLTGGHMDPRIPSLGDPSAYHAQARVALEGAMGPDGTRRFRGDKVEFWEKYLGYDPTADSMLELEGSGAYSLSTTVHMAGRWLSGLLGHEAVLDNKKKVRVEKADGVAGRSDTRAHFQPDAYRYRMDSHAGTVRMTVMDGVSVGVHELGHWWEFNDPVVMKSANDFVNRRTAGEKLTSMRELHPWSTFDADEYTKPDAFRHAYIGKTYSHGATEVISMGLQYLYESPVTFAYEDPDHFQLMVTLIHHARRRAGY